jgi:hypothetical protein
MSNADIIAWPTKTPVCLSAHENSVGAEEKEPFLVPHTLDWREHPSKTRWPMAPARGHPRMIVDGFYAVRDADIEMPQMRQIRIGWPWKADAEPTHFLECYDTGGAQAKFGPESVTAVPAATSNPQRSVFGYIVLPLADDGRRRVALRCCHGRILQLNERFQHLMPMATLTNEPGIALTIDQPVLTSTIELTRILDAPPGVPAPPAIHYRATLVNPSAEILVKAFTFTHEKSTTGTWNNEVGVSLSYGASIEVSSGVPGISASVSAHWEMTADARRSWGTSTSETQHIEDSTTISVPPHTQLDVRIVARRERIDIPFEYLIHRIGLDGQPLPTVSDRGVYQKVETLGTVVEIENIKAISPKARPTAPKRTPKS